MRAITAFILFILCSSASAQLSVDEANAKLLERDKARQEGRAKRIEVTQGEYDDMKREIAALRASVATLKAQASDPAVRKVRTEIEIGMTREEVMAFVKSHGNLRVVGVSADAGVRRASERVVVRRNTAENASADVTTVGGDGDSEADKNRGRANVKVNADGTSKTQVETVTATGRREHIEIARVGRVREQIGTQTNSFGQSAPVWGSRERQEGTISVVLLDGVVESVNAR